MNDAQRRTQLEYAMEHDYATLIKCLLLIYDRQTADEKQMEGTVVHNKVGFTGADARKLSYYARWIRSGRSLDGRFLDDCRKRMMKYSGQLIKIREPEFEPEPERRTNNEFTTLSNTNADRDIPYEERGKRVRELYACNRCGKWPIEKVIRLGIDQKLVAPKCPKCGGDTHFEKVYEVEEE